MPRKSTPAKSGKNYTTVENFEAAGFEVSNIHKWSDGSFTFNLAIDGYKFYGMRAVYNKDDDIFLSFPARKNEKDGKYYNLYYIDFSDEEKEAIINSLVK